jgi:hypothetical protein
VPFPPDDRLRLEGCLERLRPHLEPGAVAIAGGVALERALPGRRDRLADLDLVAARREAVRATITGDFLVIHLHLPQPGYARFLIQLVDPTTRVRIDVFPDRPDRGGAIGRARGAPLPLVGPEDLLARKLETLAGDGPVDPKHHADAVALAAHLGRPAPPTPPRLAPNVYSTDVDERCRRCAASLDPAFPLAPRRQVFALLGYV